MATVTLETLTARIQELRRQLAEVEQVNAALNAELRATREQVADLLEAQYAGETQARA